MDDIHLCTNDTVKCYEAYNQSCISGLIYHNSINLFLRANNRKPLVLEHTTSWIAQIIYNPANNDIYLPQYNKNDFTILESRIWSQYKRKYIYIFSNPETLLATLDILRDTLEELGLIQ